VDFEVPSPEFIDLRQPASLAAFRVIVLTLKSGL
jgi:hypothetical protein